MSKTYTAADVARGLKAIEANNGSVRAAERDTGYPRSTLRAWQAGHLPRGIAQREIADATPAAAEELAREYDEVQRLYIARLKAPEVVAKTNGRDSSIIVGVMSDKSARARGGPTSITENRTVRVTLTEPGALRSAALKVIEGGRSKPDTDKEVA